MLTCVQRIGNLDALRDYVNKTLCNREQLEIDAFEMTERILVRGSRPCGIYFCLHGPSAVKFSSIWETDRNTILFYDANGHRYHQTQLIRSPSFEPAAV